MTSVSQIDEKYFDEIEDQLTYFTHTFFWVGPHYSYVRARTPFSHKTFNILSVLFILKHKRSSFQLVDLIDTKQD